MFLAQHVQFFIIPNIILQFSLGLDYQWNNIARSKQELFHGIEWRIKTNYILFTNFTFQSSQG